VVHDSGTTHRRRWWRGERHCTGCGQAWPCYVVMASRRGAVRTAIFRRADHWPHRPTWICDAGCGEWPCGALREYLLATRLRSEIADEMAGYYPYAERELRLEPAAVHRRLFGWHQHAGWHPPGGAL